MYLEVEMGRSAPGIAAIPVVADRLAPADPAASHRPIAQMGVVIGRPVVGHQPDDLAAQPTAPNRDAAVGHGEDRLVPGRHHVGAFVAPSSRAGETPRVDERTLAGRDRADEPRCRLGTGSGRRPTLALRPGRGPSGRGRLLLLVLAVEFLALGSDVVVGRFGVVASVLRDLHDLLPLSFTP